jgi:hypothetical protein
VILLPAYPSRAGDIISKNDFTFYGDNTEFFEPYRTRETLLGQQAQHKLEFDLGPEVTLSGGLFWDFRSTSDQEPSVTVEPLLSFEYHKGGTRLIMGALDVENLHGLLEPMEVTFLEFTRPIEYGFQWIEKDPGFHADLFLNWQQLNDPSQPEAFDYGGVVNRDLADHFSLEFQYHGYHQGGKLYFIDVYNNWVPGLGLRLDLPEFLGETKLAAFGLASSQLDGGDLSQMQWGQGLYLNATVTPAENFDIFQIGWWGTNFYSQEGDANYMSYSDPYSFTVDQPHPFVQSNRTYFETGLRRKFPIEGGSLFTAELRSHFVNGDWFFSFRLWATVPLDIFLGNVSFRPRPAVEAAN